MSESYSEHEQRNIHPIISCCFFFLIIYLSRCIYIRYIDILLSCRLYPARSQLISDRISVGVQFCGLHLPSLCFVENFCKPTFRRALYYRDARNRDIFDERSGFLLPIFLQPFSLFKPVANANPRSPGEIISFPPYTLFERYLCWALLPCAWL